MNNKKTWIIISIIEAIVIIILGAVILITSNKDDVENKKVEPKQEEKEIGAFNNMSFTENGIKVDITSTEVGHPDKDSRFSAYFTKETSDGGTEEFRVEYVEVKEWLNDATTLGVTINNKEYSYFIGEDKSTANLYYVIPNTNRMALHARVIGMNKFDASGEQCKCLPTIDEELLKSKEVAGILNYKITLEDK